MKDSYHRDGIAFALLILTGVNSNPPIPLVTRWEKQMVEYGANHAEGDNIQKRGTWEGNVWCKSILQIRPGLR
jgi:hypothetical protein